MDYSLLNIQKEILQIHEQIKHASQWKYFRLQKRLEKLEDDYIVLQRIAETKDVIKT